MKQHKHFNPIRTAERIEKSYRDYVASTIHFDDENLRNQFECLLSRKGYLAKGPFVEAVPPYTRVETPRRLVESGELCDAILSLGNGDPRIFNPDRQLYTHQVKAIRKANAGKNLAVVTGTGSGKTECFLLPILNDILSEFKTHGYSPGVRALILYPMNALANDQLRRLRGLLSGTEVTFGRYTGDTRESHHDALNAWRDENPGSVLPPNEIISREEIRKAPPNILITNYAMLEYLLLRPEDAPLFNSSFGLNWRHIAIDEAHIYSGALGTEIAFLLRRLKARIAGETGSMPSLRCYATSATIGTDKDLSKVAKFAGDLFGEPFSQSGDIDVITSDKDVPEASLRMPWGRLSLRTWIELRKLIVSEESIDEGAVLTLLKQEIPTNEIQGIHTSDLLLLLGHILLGEESTATLVRKTSTGLIDLTSSSEIEQLDIPGLHGDDEGIEILASMVDVLSVALRAPDIPVLSVRYHSLLKAPEGLYINLYTNLLSSRKKLEEDCGFRSATPVYEVSVCRHCGQAFILGNERLGSGGNPPTLSPKHLDIDTDEDFSPRTYYRIVQDTEGVDEDECVIWLCPVCGALHTHQIGGKHMFPHPEVKRIALARGTATEDDAKCGHCGYRSPKAIQPLRVSSEAIGSVVCYELVRDIPPIDQETVEEEDNLFAGIGEDDSLRAGSVICFSDKRQDAAFFAPAMDRTYGNITVRQILREAIKEKCTDSDSCTPTALINWIDSTAPRRYSVAFGKEDPRDLAAAWVLDELQAEDSRNSLDGLGVVRIEPTAFIKGMQGSTVKNVIAKQVEALKSEFPWLTTDDYSLLATICLETLREQGAISVPLGVDQLRRNASIRGDSLKGLKVIQGYEETGGHGVIAYVGRSTGTENKRSLLLRKYVKRIYNVNLSRSEAVTILQSLFTFTKQYLGAFKDLGLRPTQALEGHPDNFRLNKDIWSIYPGSLDDRLYICDTCGCCTHLNTRGVCLTSKCKGTSLATTYGQIVAKDRYYKDLYYQDALPIRIEEHTAQLSTERARNIQSEFINGDVNVLSCTTTFELGVDVGDLRAVFMRNVPPSTANYTQRAGRAGRRAGLPGYAITFAKMRPHDFHVFDHPEAFITGSTRVPMCYLDNEQIAIRHVFAIALSEYFREGENADCAKEYRKFLNLGEQIPEGLKSIARYLHGHPHRLYMQLISVFNETGTNSTGDLVDKLGIKNWNWIDKLINPGNLSTGEHIGRLMRVHQLKYLDYERIQDAIYQARAKNETKLERSLLYTRSALEKEKTIAALSEGGVLPKYGFPTDVVELHVPLSKNRFANSDNNTLQLERGMRQAIFEYAPGSEIIADKHLWRSIGVRRPRGESLITRKYGFCPHCDNFVWPIDNLSDDTCGCPVCGKNDKERVRLNRTMLVPSLGFEGVEIKKGIGLNRPHNQGFASVYFSQHWPAEFTVRHFAFDGGEVFTRYANNAELCLVNTGRNKGFWVCGQCGASSNEKKVEHFSFCSNYERGAKGLKHYNSLGSSFTTDVLELDLVINSISPFAEDAWESVSWALLTAASQLLEVSLREINCIHYQSDANHFKIMIYDDVPGGAGYSLQLGEEVDSLIKLAYDIVKECSCGEETCCYGCIANYYNQTKQNNLSRGAAKKILGALLKV